MDPCAKRHFDAVTPDFRSDGLAGIDRRRKSQAQALQPCRVVVATDLHDCIAGHAKRTQTMQDRPIEAGRLGDLRIGVQRVGIAAQPLDQGRLRNRSADHIFRRVSHPGGYAAAIPARLARQTRCRAHRGSYPFPFMSARYRERAMPSTRRNQSPLCFFRHSAVSVFRSTVTARKLQFIAIRLFARTSAIIFNSTMFCKMLRGGDRLPADHATQDE